MCKKWLLAALAVLLLLGMVPSQPAAADDPPVPFVMFGGDTWVTLEQGEVGYLAFQVMMTGDNIDYGLDIPTVIIDDATDQPATWIFTRPESYQKSWVPIHVFTENLTKGVHHVRLEVGPVGDNGVASHVLSIHVLPARKVMDLVLIDALNDVPLGPLTCDTVIDLSELGHNQINIEAVAPEASSVEFFLYGPKFYNRRDNNPPRFTLKGTSGDNYYGLWLHPGEYTVVVAADYQAPDMAVQFTVVD